MKIEVRSNAVHIQGYVNVVERNSRLLASAKGKFVEKVKAKTFQRALEATDNVDLLYNHDYNKKLGSTKDGNLELYEDEIGLRAIATITDAEVIELAKNKKLTGWSFAFNTIEDSWRDGDDGIAQRTLEKITLPEVSILSVTPAYIATSIEMRDDIHTIIEYRNADSIEYVEQEQRSEIIDYSVYENEIAIIKMKATELQ